MTFERNFMTGSLGAGAVFTRASTGWYTNASGTLVSAATNAPRFDYDPVTLQLKGVLLEDASTNLLLNSSTLGTQSVAVTAQAYTLSFYGTGTITKSGAATGALVGTGAAQRVSQTFTPTAGTLTCTVSGSVVNAQLEALAYPTSWISTAGATASRAADVLSYPIASVTGFSTTQGSLAHEYILAGAIPSFAAPAALVGSATGTDYILPAQFDGSGTATTPSVNAAALSTAAANTYCVMPTTSAAAGPAHRSASSWLLAGVMHNAHDGVGDTSNGGPVTALPVVVNLTIGQIVHSQFPVSQWARRIRYWPRQLSQSELVSVTS